VKILASHALLIGPVAERLGKLPIEKIYVSDSVPAPDQFPLPLQISSLASLLAKTTQRPSSPAVVSAVSWRINGSAEAALPAGQKSAIVIKTPMNNPAKA
jgi:hypothetical protein